jgi:hypothetical protein
MSLPSWSFNMSQQQHISFPCDLLPPPTHACFLPFEQQVVQLHESILKCLHHHTFFSMFFDGISEAHYVWNLSCFSPKASVWFTTRQVFLTFQLPSLVFSIALRTWLGLPHPLIICILQCVCTHPINLMGIHFLCCVHGNEHIGTHDAIRNTFATITQNLGFHVGKKQIHALPLITFNSFRQWIDIVLTKDGICTLTNIVIVNPMSAYLLLWSCAIQGFVTFDVVQAKERSYCNQHPINQFLPLTIEIFGCLHKHVDVFLHDCVNVIWSLKGPRGLHLSTLVTFLHKKVLITL